MTEATQPKQPGLSQDQYDLLLFNAFAARQEILTRLGMGETKRDINKACGYPTELTLQDLVDIYRRDTNAKRVVNVLPRETWKKTPTVFEDDDVDVTTPFEEAWADIAKQLRGESFYEGDDGNPVWEVLLRVDVLSGLGDFGIVFIGIDDGLDPDKPATLTAGFVRHKLLFLQVYDRRYVKVLKVEQDPNNRRHGLPTEYELTLDLPVESGQTMQQRQIKVHWTRVLHVADNIETNEWSGVPRLQTPYNRLHDLRKIYGGSGEGYWQSAVPILSIETHPSAAGADIEVDVEATRKQVANVMGGFQRHLNLIGLTAKTVSPTVNDPTPHVAVGIEAVCIDANVPVRIFKGSERGELASTTDDDTHTDRIILRQKTYVTPRIIVPFVDRLILLGVLPKPQSYSVDWGDLHTMSKKDRAQTALVLTQAMGTYVEKNVESVITPSFWWEHIVGMDPDTAQAICEATDEVFSEDRPLIQDRKTVPPDPIAQATAEAKLAMLTNPPKQGADKNGKEAQKKA